jgi:hypothetical protein
MAICLQVANGLQVADGLHAGMVLQLLVGFTWSLCYKRWLVCK